MNTHPRTALMFTTKSVCVACLASLLGLLAPALSNPSALANESDDVAPWEEVPAIVEMLGIGDQFPPDTIGKFEALLSEWCWVNFGENPDLPPVSFDAFIASGETVSDVEQMEHVFMLWWFFWADQVNPEWYLD